ncbi:prostaglandin D2 receptor 2 [Centropristis striata]|uniref:prostaglandin D2 receptor 2 n=1 Tax=Centropristis striata TaxID=184440 RepID=UPI0027E1A62D|nr:prostaglandin D2 receptor 2 [Centropristis striata]
MSNTSDVSGGPLVCPLLHNMMEHRLNNNTQANLVVVCIHGLVSCLGILENALILWVVGFRLQRRTVASVWVLNLAMSDFLATLTLPLFTHYLSSSHNWELGSILCKTQASSFYLNMFVSAFLLAAISVDRCLLAAKPVWSQNHRTVAGAWKVCVLGWLWAAINTLPYLMFRSVTEKLDGRKLCYHNFALYSSQDTLERNCKIRQAATAISKLLLAFLFPLVVIAGNYIQIVLTLRNRSRRRKQSTGRFTDALIMSNKDGVPETTPTTTKTTNIFLKPPVSGPLLSLTPTKLSPTNQTNNSQLSKSFTRMVTFVIAAFVLCWAPYHVFCLIEVTAQYWPKNLKYVEVGLPLATTLAFLNPVLNPILYAFSCPNFCVRIRQSLGAVFEGLVEEGGGLLMAPGKSLRAHIRRKSSKDVSLGTPTSPKSSHSPHLSPHSQPSFPLPSPSEGPKDTHMELTRQEAKDEVEDS